jgi:uncharacterized SAM-dependent methyltransferase
MPKRTLRTARNVFDQMAPGLNPEMFRRLQKEIDEASNAATSMAGQYADKRINGLLGNRQEVLTDLCRIRDAFKAVAAEAALGNLSSREVNDRLADLRREMRSVDRHAEDVERATELVDRIEEDPEGWADETFYEKYPHMTPDFSF